MFLAAHYFNSLSMRNLGRLPQRLTARSPRRSHRSTAPTALLLCSCCALNAQQVPSLTAALPIANSLMYELCYNAASNLLASSVVDGRGAGGSLVPRGAIYTVLRCSRAGPISNSLHARAFPGSSACLQRGRQKPKDAKISSCAPVNSPFPYDRYVHHARVHFRTQDFLADDSRLRTTAPASVGPCGMEIKVTYKLMVHLSMYARYLRDERVPRRLMAYRGSVSVLQEPVLHYGKLEVNQSFLRSACHGQFCDPANCENTKCQKVQTRHSKVILIWNGGATCALTFKSNPVVLYSADNTPLHLG
ncbi:hypothetical protein C8J57DRAFT_1226415 [Mycena rebaudengoi]|nr:hypothetical protein C8J57DRAFT_1226415 [Mycena rebaudengoi]